MDDSQIVINKGHGFTIWHLYFRIFFVKEGWNLLDGDGDVPSHVGSNGAVVRVMWGNRMLHNRFYPALW